MDSDTAYSRTFYDTIRGGCQSSAARVVPEVMRLMPWVETVVDVGCGEGWWAAEFANHGCDVLGVDGAYVGGSPLGERFLAHDLTQPLSLSGRQFDLAVSLEVAEHLPSERARGFVDDLCRLAPTVLFSAAIPGQGGTGHLNEQWPDYWARMFAANGYPTSATLRWTFWEDPGVENWYAQNMLVASNQPDMLTGLFNSAQSTVRRVVHPVLWDARRER
jgi:SAM-dependent methyltransferase